MAYSPDYTSDDLSSIVIDGLGKFGVAIIAFIALVALVVLYAWFRKRM
jgi:hypothetical protein